MTSLLFRILFLWLLPLSAFSLQLVDGKNFIYDIGQNGALVRGTLDAYLGMYQLRIDDTNYVGHVASLSPDGREARLEVFVEPQHGLEVKRHIYVSKTLNFTRFSEIIRNPTDHDVTTEVEIFGKLGSNSRTSVLVDQKNFLITDDVVNEVSGSSPVLLHYHSQTNHPITATPTINGNQLSWRYSNITIPAKSQIRLIYFVAQTTDLDSAKEVATLIFSNPSSIYEGMGSVARQELLNFIPPQATPHDNFGQVPFINIGEQRMGTLDEGDPLSHARASTPSEAYAVNLKEKETVTLRMSASFNAYLYLFDDEAGRALLQANDDQDNQTTQAEIVFTAPQSKTYYIEATTHHRRDLGGYTLEVIEGATNRPPQAYPFEWKAEKLVAPATISFTDFSFDKEGNIVEWCWQFGEGSSLVCDTKSTVTHTFEQAGQYNVGLTLRDQEGAYAYVSQQVSIPSTLEGIVLPLSNTVSGELASSDARSQTRSSAFVDRYIIRSLLPGQEIVIEMSSTHFDSYLYLYDEFNRLIRQDDNSAGGKSARIRYTPLKSGELLVEATSFQDNALGHYSLTLELASNFPSNQIPIESSTFFKDPLQGLFVARLPNSFTPNFFLWNFGDNTPVVGSNEAVVSHTYSHNGRFSVTVTVVDKQGQELKGQQEFTIVDQPFIPQTRFRATPLFGENPLRVFFTNESFSNLPGDELRYIWQFGDGQVSTDTHPAHTFTQEGTYQVLLQTYSKLNQQSASYSIPISVIDRESAKIPVIGTTRLRPQVLMAGFDPMLIDLLDTDVKIFAWVRPGEESIQTVRVMQNGSEFTLVMQHVATYPNGDQRYETVLTLTKGILPVTTYANLFGDKPGQFRVQAVSQSGQFHAYPNLEIGHNPVLSNVSTSLNIQPLRQVGVRRSSPQVLAAGFDPALVDITETQFMVKAIVREGLFPIKTVMLKQNQGMLTLPMYLQEVLPNGDKLYGVNYTYPRESLEMSTWGSLFGDQTNPAQFVVTVTDQNQQSHSFPELKVGNFPQQ